MIIQGLLSANYLTQGYTSATSAYWIVTQGYVSATSESLVITQGYRCS